MRGMLGWMAALSQGSTRRQLIELDPYAVVANGDPSEFTTGSKKTLLKTLSQLADTKPLFRRSDAWRQFNIGTFFTADIRDDVVALLSPICLKRRSKAASGAINQHATILKSEARRINQRFFDPSMCESRLFTHRKRRMINDI